MEWRIGSGREEVLEKEKRKGEKEEGGEVERPSLKMCLFAATSKSKKKKMGR